MPYNGDGTFIREHNWATDKANSIKITASRCDAEDDGFATGLSNCITKDGQTTISANIPFNSKKITGLGNGSARTDSIALGQVQDNTYGTLGTLGGSANTYTAAPSPAITAYATGSRYILKVNADNTGASTLNISAVGAKNIKKYDGAGAKVDVEAADLQQDQYYDVFYDGTDLVVLNPQKPYFDATNVSVAGSLQSVQVFTSSGTWTKPSGINNVVVEVQAGGGGGGGAASSVSCSGGGAGGYSKKLITSSLGATETITIGAGGTAGASGGSNGSAGGSSSFGAHCSATGGGGGFTNGTSGVGGIGSSGDVNLRGNAGQSVAPSAAGTGGAGGPSIFGGSGRGQAGVGSPAEDGSGAGGAGGCNNTSGGAGGSGIIIVWEYS